MMTRKTLRFVLTGGLISALSLANGLAIGQGDDEIKVEPSPRSVQDIKPLAAAHPPKADAPADVPQAIIGECLEQKSADTAGGFVPPVQDTDRDRSGCHERAEKEAELGSEAEAHGWPDPLIGRRAGAA